MASKDVSEYLKKIGSRGGKTAARRMTREERRKRAQKGGVGKESARTERKGL